MLTRQCVRRNGQRAKTKTLPQLLDRIAYCAWRVRLAEAPGDQHFQAGLAYERLGRYDDAYTELQLAFALDQDNAELALALGIVASRLGRHRSGAEGAGTFHRAGFEFRGVLLSVGASL